MLLTQQADKVHSDILNHADLLQSFCVLPVPWAASHCDNRGALAGKFRMTLTSQAKSTVLRRRDQTARRRMPPRTVADRINYSYCIAMACRSLPTWAIIQAPLPRLRYAEIDVWCDRVPVQSKTSETSRCAATSTDNITIVSQGVSAGTLSTLPLAGSQRTGLVAVSPSSCCSLLPIADIRVWHSIDAEWHHRSSFLLRSVLLSSALIVVMGYYGKAAVGARVESTRANSL